jgi:hypothetical protein
MVWDNMLIVWKVVCLVQFAQMDGRCLLLNDMVLESNISILWTVKVLNTETFMVHYNCYL